MTLADYTLRDLNAIAHRLNTPTRKMSRLSDALEVLTQQLHQSPSAHET